MLIQRRTKTDAEKIRSTLSLAEWLDEGEIIATLAPVVISLGTSGWSTSPHSCGDCPYDPAPLELVSVTVIEDMTMVQLYVNGGTPGNVYTIKVLVFGTSGREVEMTVQIQITGDPPCPVPPIVPTPLNLDALSIMGGNMLGSLYLWRDPLTPAEAATKRYVDWIFEGLSIRLQQEIDDRIAGDNLLDDKIDAEIARATGVENALASPKQLVAGAGLIGGTITLSGIVPVLATIAANWQQGVVTTVGSGLTLGGGVLASNWSLGLITGVSAGLSIVGGILTANWQDGVVTSLGTGISNPGGVLTPNWQAGIITSVGAGLSLSGGVLSNTVGASTWNAGAVNSVSAGLQVTGGVLITNWQSPLVNTFGAGLTHSGSTLGAQWHAGDVGAVGGGLSLSGGVLSVTGAGGGAGMQVRTGSFTSAADGTWTVTFPSPFPTGCVTVYAHGVGGFANLYYVTLEVPGGFPMLPTTTTASGRAWGYVSGAGEPATPALMTDFTYVAIGY